MKERVNKSITGLEMRSSLEIPVRTRSPCNTTEQRREEKRSGHEEGGVERGGRRKGRGVTRRAFTLVRQF